jgi:hypothetical protein
MPDKTRKIK